LLRVLEKCIGLLERGSERKNEQGRFFQNGARTELCDREILLNDRNIKEMRAGSFCAGYEGDLSDAKFLLSK